MNNKEIRTIIKLRNEKKKIEEELSLIMDFLLTYQNSFKYQKSIIALNKIHEYFNKKHDRSKEIDVEVQNIANTMGEVCQHHILIELPLSHECPICKKSYSYGDKLPDTTEYIIMGLDYDSEYNDKEYKKLESIVLNSSDEKTASEEILSYLNNLQFSKDIKIRRYKK